MSLSAKEYSKYEIEQREWEKVNEGFGRCLHCGGIAEVLTKSDNPDKYLYDSEHARCTECSCPGITMLCYEGGKDVIKIDWHDEPDCNCEWCKKHAKPFPH